MGVTGHHGGLWKEQVKTEFRTTDDRDISVAMYVACGTRTDVARALGSILEAPGGFGFPGRARGWSTQGLRAVTLPHRWYGGMAQESHEHTSLRPG